MEIHRTSLIQQLRSNIEQGLKTHRLFGKLNILKAEIVYILLANNLINFSYCAI
jgi:hypothetical protein